MIKRANKTDAYEIAKLAVCMWVRHTTEELAQELEEMIQNKEAAIFLKYAQATAVGFAVCQLRHDYVEGTHSSPVGYLEAIYVKDEFRNKGYAKELLEACETWAKECNCTEFASDCELSNDVSLSFHLNVGFEEANRIICFTKKL